jgi:hypothetical protein
VYKQKTRIIARLLELPQPGREEKLLLELPDGSPSGSRRAFYRTVCAYPCELHLRFTEGLWSGREENMTVFPLLGAGACLQGKADHALAVGKFWGRDLALLTEVRDGGSSTSLFCGRRKIERKKSQNTFK